MGLFSKDIKTLDDLFVHTLQDIYYAENQIAKALPEMAEKATDPQLKQAFKSHLDETKQQIKMVEQVFRMMMRVGPPPNRRYHPRPRQEPTR